MTRRRTLERSFLLALPAVAAATTFAVSGLPAHAAVGSSEPRPGAFAVGTDTIEVDRVLPDTLIVPGRIHPDTLLPEELRDALLPPDTLSVEEEPEVRRLPVRATPLRPGWHTGVWEWDREALEATRALTLLELLEQIPGVTPLRGGDFGQPASATAFGVGAGRIRVFLDAAELAPLNGGVADLSRIGLSGIGRVRVERRGGELRVEMWPLQLVDPRAYTLLEVGTGDLNTNVFRGTFGHPDALGGSIVVSLDRVDTQGPFGQEPGASFGGHLRHTIFRGDRGGVAWEYRRMTSRRPAALWDPGTVGRTDLALHGRYELGGNTLASVFVQRSSLDGDPDGDALPDVVVPVDEATRTQVGGRLSWQREGLWGEADARWNRGPRRPGTTLGMSGGGERAGLGGLSASLEREGWDEGSGVTVHARAWTGPVAGVSLFAEFEDGSRGIPRWEPPPEDPADEEVEPSPPEPVSFDQRRQLRAGAEYRRDGLQLGAAAVRVEADSLHPLGLEWDREGPVLPGGTRDAIEVSGRLPLAFLLNGLALEGAVQLWDSGEAWRYVPGESYQGAVRFRDVFLESRNLEVWFDLGVRGRGAMAVPLADAGPTGVGAVPSLQSWYGFLQIRISSAKLFLSWDNFTIRQQNQDFPDRLQPPTRAMYGIRWTMWN